MPIKGISEKRRWIRLGKIRIGEKAISEKTGQPYPKAVDHFVVPPEVAQIYGEDPKELEIILPSNDSEQVFPQYYKRYASSKGLLCKGDGQTANKIIEGTNEFDEIECDGEECELYQQKKCRRVATLVFNLPRVDPLGVWHLDTSSYNSIVNINTVLDIVRRVAGKIADIPLTLRIEPQQAQVNGTKKNIFVLKLWPTSRMLKYLLLKRTKQIDKDLIEQEPVPEAAPETIPEDKEFKETLFPGE